MLAIFLYVATATDAQPQLSMSLCAMDSVKTLFIHFVYSSSERSAQTQSFPAVKSAAFKAIGAGFWYLHIYSYRHANA